VQLERFESKKGGVFGFTYEGKRRAACHLFACPKAKLADIEETILEAVRAQRDAGRFVTGCGHWPAGHR
jgi:hypothetical protein